MNTPSVATKVLEFSRSQSNHAKEYTDMKGQNIYNIVFSTTYNTDLILEENYMYSFYSDTLMSDGDIVKDGATNEYEVFVLNGTSIAIAEYFELRIIGTTAYIYKY